MINEFHYPEDRAELFEGPNEEEAHFYFSLKDFEEFLEKYGAHFVLSRMRNDPFQLLAEWFYEENHSLDRKEKLEKIGALLCSSQQMPRP